MYESWNEFLEEEQKKQYYSSLLKKISDDRLSSTVYPDDDVIFRAFELTPLSKVRVVILGQDPYHDGSADGLAFSCSNKIPQSLKNIFREYESDLGKKAPKTGDLTAWCQNGVLLLNTSLTVLGGKPLSHSKIGWERFMKQVILTLDSIPQKIVFILWGNESIKWKRYLTNIDHLIIESPHPSPLSAYRGFFGSKPFSKACQFLGDNNLFDFT